MLNELTKKRNEILNSGTLINQALRLVPTYRRGADCLGLKILEDYDDLALASVLMGKGLKGSSNLRQALRDARKLLSGE